MKQIKPTQVDDNFLNTLLGIESSKIGFYGEVRQKIQELEAANLSLRVKKAELQAIFDAISDAVVIYDAKGLVQHRNHVCPRFFPTETLIGTNCKALFHADKKSNPDFCPIEKALGGKSSHLSYYRIHDDNGRKAFYDVVVTPIEDLAGGTRALVFFRDVTDRRMRELQLLHAEKMSSIGVLAAGVAHEINNPLTSVAGYAEALQRRFRDDPSLVGDQRLLEFPKYLEVIVREAYRCKGIIESLLSFSRKSDGSFERVDLNMIIGEVLELLQHKGRDERITLQNHLRDPLPPVLGDASALRQVILNLVLNAFHAISESGTVRLETDFNTTEVVVKVIDDGCGIEPGMLDQIWSPFFTTKGVGKGQGLGLAITYDVIEKHHGSIEVHSQIGVGSEFHVKIPLGQDVQ
ncbi:MAG: PAS domain S-box protein [Desulfuromonadales bacterium]|nr:PAS domain S-box protein [Desulfuromonadales bacterium]